MAITTGLSFCNQLYSKCEMSMLKNFNRSKSQIVWLYKNKIHASQEFLYFKCEAGRNDACTASEGMPRFDLHSHISCTRLFWSRTLSLWSWSFRQLRGSEKWSLSMYKWLKIVMGSESSFYEGCEGFEFGDTVQDILGYVNLLQIE